MRAFLPQPSANSWGGSDSASAAAHHHPEERDMAKTRREKVMACHRRDMTSAHRERRVTSTGMGPARLLPGVLGALARVNWERL